ncbi:hypothetical protein KC460_04950 [Candidatus Dependentiae bacterium]|nr:hypothetical protein [Candidatus Dependentiae bacterium]
MKMYTVFFIVIGLICISGAHLHGMKSNVNDKNDNSKAGKVCLNQEKYVKTLKRMQKLDQDNYEKTLSVRKAAICLSSILGITTAVIAVCGCYNALRGGDVSISKGFGFYAAASAFISIMSIFPFMDTQQNIKQFHHAYLLKNDDDGDDKTSFSYSDTNSSK